MSSAPRRIYLVGGEGLERRHLVYHVKYRGDKEMTGGTRIWSGSEHFLFSLREGDPSEYSISIQEDFGSGQVIASLSTGDFSRCSRIVLTPSQGGLMITEE